MRANRSFVKRVAVDIGGFGLLLAAILFSWVPGPGGIPLFFAGLALLATNHDWADRLLKYLKKHASNLVDIIFPDHKWLKIVYDILAVAAVSYTSIYLLSVEDTLARSALMILGVLGLTVFFLNRKRAKHVGRILRKWIVS